MSSRDHAKMMSQSSNIATVPDASNVLLHGKEGHWRQKDSGHKCVQLCGH